MFKRVIIEIIETVETKGAAEVSISIGVFGSIGSMLPATSSRICSVKRWKRWSRLGVMHENVIPLVFKNYNLPGFSRIRKFTF